MSSEHYDLVLAGVGGQGIIFAGQILMEAALKYDHKVYGFEMHGMARRGGAVSTHIRFGKEVFSPLVPMGSGRLLAAFEPVEALRNVRFMDKGAVVIINTASVIPVSVSAGEGTYPDIREIEDAIGGRCANIHTFDATSLAQEAGDPITMNVVMLGAICSAGVIPIQEDVMLEVVKKRTPAHLCDMNVAAFQKGYDTFKD
ncbi:MAG: indolepyruvate oxidoreductase subunit beta [Thermoplasmata archaeon]|nr:MAG: indolepyruvate oxidoreductase subunit beta [Thermoplasmata archaeon]